MIHKFLRRFSLLLAAAFMTAGITSAQVGAGWEYDESTKTLTLSGDNVDWSGFKGYKSSVEYVVFAENFSVKVIGSKAFEEFSSLKEITIPYGVTSIEDNAFYWCSSLTSINLPNGLQSIGEWAFYNCSLTSISLQEGLQNIGEYAFSKCPLTSITLPKGLESIGESAFSLCSLTSVTLPKGLKSIGVDAFGGCTFLTSINLPEGLQSIGDDAFFMCIYLPSINLPEGLQRIGSCAFYMCESLTSVTLPATLEYIGDHAFDECGKLDTVIIKSNGTSAEDHYILLGDDNTDDEYATGSNVFPYRKATLFYDSNTTWIGDNNTQNLLYYFDDKLGKLEDLKEEESTSINTPTIPSAPAQYYDLAGRKVNNENHKGIVVKVQDGKSKLMMIK